MGRPVEMKDKRRGSNFSVYLDGQQIEVLNEIRWRERDSVSGIIRKAIEEYVKNHAEGNSTFKLDRWQEDPEFKALPTLLSHKEKWENYIDECSNKECTEIAIMSNFISNKINRRRTQENNQKIKENDPIYQYYKKQGKVD